MTPPFMPLVPPGGSGVERTAAVNQLRLLALPGPSTVASPGSGHPALAVVQDHGSPAHAATGGATAAADGRCPSAPALTLRREGERIVGIRIQCGCGQLIELECTYP